MFTNLVNTYRIPYGQEAHNKVVHGFHELTRILFNNIII
jgi:hypothetical protein